jgi:predicted transcriptional regulator
MDAIPQLARDLLVSLHPRHALNILTGEKTVELRRRFPEQHTRGALALIYSTAPVQAIVGVARIKHVLKLPVSRIWKEYGAAACVSKAEIGAYFSGLRKGYVTLERLGCLEDNQSSDGSFITMPGCASRNNSANAFFRFSTGYVLG